MTSQEWEERSPKAKEGIRAGLCRRLGCWQWGLREGLWCYKGAWEGEGSSQQRPKESQEGRQLAQEVVLEISTLKFPTLKLIYVVY